MAQKHSPKSYTTAFAKDMLPWMALAPQVLAETLNAYDNFENVFNQVSNPADILELLQNISSPEIDIDHDRFYEAIAKFPVEATLIRAEMRYPEIANDISLLERIQNALSDTLDSETTNFSQLTLNLKEKFHSNISSDAGPRKHPISETDIYALIQLWNICDQLVQDHLDAGQEDPETTQTYILH